MVRDAVLMDEKDNVATAIRHLPSNTKVSVQNGHETIQITLTQTIPFGHKLCVKRIPSGGDVVKYGEAIGTATTDINPGEHVHIHNVRSGRGR